MKTLSYIIVSLLIALPCYGATYTFYVDADCDTPGDGTSDTCSDASTDPFQTIAQANTAINDANSDDVINLFFDRGDTWSYDSAQASKPNDDCYGVLASVGNPIVKIDAYGTGEKPKFDGLVGEAGYEDFPDVPVHDEDTGPEWWNVFFKFKRKDCSVKNIEVTRVYGHAIWGAVNGSEGLVVENCDINNFGNSGVIITPASGTDGTDVSVRYNTIHTGQQLNRYDKGVGWGGGIDLDGTNVPVVTRNLIAYNVIYDIYGEGINVMNATTEYNIVGDTYSLGIEPGLHKNDGGENIVRYNLITFSNWTTSIYDSGNSVGIRVWDQDVDGNNTAADFKIYGNIIINRYHGFRYFNNVGTTIPSVKVFNNTIIDSHDNNIMFEDPGTITAGTFYNNTSILYDRISSDIVSDSGLPHANITIENNHFWITGGFDCNDTNDLDDWWSEGCQDGDPLLAGEPSVDWDGQTGSTYYKDINVVDVYPGSGSPLWGSGKTLTSPEYNLYLLTLGSVFAGLPEDAVFRTKPQRVPFGIGALVHRRRVMLIQ